MPAASERERAEAHGRAARERYVAALDEIVGRPPPAPGALALHVVAYSGRRDLPEQVASVRSLLRHAGAPLSITIVSDGSHDDRGRELLAAIHPSVRVAEVDEVTAPDLPPAVADYGRRHALGRKLALELSLPLDAPTLFADADVLFFEGARELGAMATEPTPRYLLDCGPYLDERLLRDGEQRDPVNGGVFVLHRPLDWERALARLRALGAPPVFHTEQTLLHLALHEAGASRLAPDRYVVSLSDESRAHDDHAGPGIALRHYTTPVRHKFWCAVAP